MAEVNHLAGLGFADGQYGAVSRRGAGLVGGHHDVKLMLCAVDHDHRGTDVVRVAAERGRIRIAPNPATGLLLEYRTSYTRIECLRQGAVPGGARVSVPEKRGVRLEYSVVKLQERIRQRVQRSLRSDRVFMAHDESGRDEPLERTFRTSRMRFLTN